jgi:hypothetical protein
LATKFETHHEIIANSVEGIEALKTYAIANDLHMEAYQPIQTATIAYEVAKGLIPSHKQEKYRTNFIRKVVRGLEKNCVDVCNPNSEKKSRYAKMDYNISSSLLKYGQDQNRGRWEKILEKVTFDNIHLHSDQVKGAEKLTDIKEGV